MGEIPVRRDGLQLDEDRRFQEQFWTAERVAWGLFGLVILLALAGFTGAGGPAAQASRQISDARIDYPRIARWTTPVTFSIHFSEAGSRDLVLSPDFLSTFEIETMVPRPSASSVAPEGLHLTFEVDGPDAAPVLLSAKPLSVGPFTYDITIDGAAPSGLATLVLP